MQMTEKAKHRQEPEQWNTDSPYSRMLADYERAAHKLVHRISELRAELKRMQEEKAGTLASARAQMLLEQRIQMLRSEYEDVRDVMDSVRFYAKREVQP